MTTTAFDVRGEVVFGTAQAIYVSDVKSSHALHLACTHLHLMNKYNNNKVTLKLFFIYTVYSDELITSYFHQTRY